MTIIKNLGLCLLLAMLITACKKRQGPAGADGKDGNANVKATTVGNLNWTYTSPDYTTIINVPAITQDIMSNGAVMVYLVDGGTQIQLPVTFHPTAQYSETYSFDCFVGGVKLYITDSDHVQPPQPSGDYKFKIVVMAGSGLVKQVNVKDHSEVQTLSVGGE